ncbi:MAG: 30S ribosomal protein S16 [Actinomycetota bacterium]
MATRIRLRRMGAKKRPFYRVVVADQRAPRDGRFIENIGKYHPLEDPSLIEIDEERALHWLRVGAQPSSQVRNLMVKIGIWDRFVEERPSAADLVRKRTEKPATGRPSKKAVAKAAAEAETPPVEVEAPVAAEEPGAVEPPADSAPEVSAEAESPLAEDTSDGGAGSASDSTAPPEDAAPDSAPEDVPAPEDAPAEDVPAAEETSEA